ncbi:MAG: Nif3-like dinuclear metal center hexameric protein [Clostridia bacterium]|nr:Nif3-like dinuclear metal center hexameric protein [Clostridia bacterium]
MNVKVKNIYDIVNEIAPFEKAEPWDNVGLLAGSMDREVTGILCALDFTHEVLEKAEELGANLIITHHPILFSARKRLTEDDYEGRVLCEMIRKNISLIAAHTNYDVAVGGVNDILSEKLNLQNIRMVEGDDDGILRIGDIAPVSLSEFSKQIENALKDVVRVYGNPDKIIKTVAVCGGSGGEYASLAYRAGADAYVTGEMRYHDSLNFALEGYASLHAGHDATERIAIKPLKDSLQNLINELQYNLKVFLFNNMGVES